MAEKNNNSKYWMILQNLTHFDFQMKLKTKLVSGAVHYNSCMVKIREQKSWQKYYPYTKCGATKTLSEGLWKTECGYAEGWSLDEWKDPTSVERALDVKWRELIQYMTYFLLIPLHFKWLAWTFSSKSSRNAHICNFTPRSMLTISTSHCFWVLNFAIAESCP